MSKKPWNKNQYRKAKEHQAVLWGKLHDTSEAGKIKRANFLTQQYFNSHHVRYFHAVEAYRKLKPHLKSKKIDFAQLTATVDPYKGTTEPVIFDVQIKECGFDYRPIKDYGIENRTMQGMVLAVLKARTHLSENQFANVGGRNEAVKRVVQNLSDGYNWCVELDIQNCFPSVSVQALSERLPIPNAVIDHVISCEHCCAIPGSRLMNWVDPEGDLSHETEESDFLAEALEEGRPGLPQGSAVSSYVMELLLAPILADAPNGVRLVGYADNILVMGMTDDDMVSMLFSLGAALKEHPVGPFSSTCGEITSPKEEFGFLGYEFQPEPVGVKLAPSSRKLAEFQHKFDIGLDRLEQTKMSAKRRKKIKANLRRYVRGWCAGFSFWSKIESFRENRMKDIAEASAKGAG